MCYVLLLLLFVTIQQLRGIMAQFIMQLNVTKQMQSRAVDEWWHILMTYLRHGCSDCSLQLNRNISCTLLLSCYSYTIDVNVRNKSVVTAGGKGEGRGPCMLCSGGRYIICSPQTSPLPAWTAWIFRFTQHIAISIQRSLLISSPTTNNINI